MFKKKEKSNKKLLVKGVIKVSKIIETNLDPEDREEEKQIAEAFYKNLQEYCTLIYSEDTLPQIRKFDISVEILPQ